MLIDIIDFYFKWQVWEIITSKPRKMQIVKHIESYKPKGRCQADIVLLSNYIWDGFKYIFTMMDHLTKYGWIIPLNDKKVDTILRALKNVSPRIIFLIDFRLITEESSKTIFLKIFINQKVLLEFMESLNNPNTKEQLKHLIELFKISWHQQKTTKRIDIISKNLLITFLYTYYNDREHSTTKVAPFRAMMNI